ncbi:MFS transporter [Burkholderia sp. PAMC 28687]|uniref:MFS transporter n=1 Tax=Burkholderia sp. PAMC 28687 TaxID=1795874 RepID=UPI000AB8E338|nr:MFS transporter [Burkholderia sp. PAMC 28687]
MNETNLILGGRKAWTIVVLVFLFMLINFADKAVVGLSSTAIITELRLTHAQFGALGSAFFLLFSISGVAIGFLSNHVSTKRIMLVMSVIWALALLPMTGTVSFVALFGSRVILGAAEGPAFPVALHAVYKWFGDNRRAVPTSVVACGAAFGAGVVAPLITWIIVRYSWHAAFAALAVAGLAWAIVWAAVGEDGPIGHVIADGVAPTRIPYRYLILSRTALGVYIAGFAAYWMIALNIVWLANYLIRAVHLSPSTAAWVIALPSVMQIVLAPCFAFISQRLAKNGYSSRVARGAFGCVCVIGAGAAAACLPMLALGPLKILLIGLAFSIGSVIFTLGSTLIGEICPSSQRGALLGITNSVHTLAGLIAPVAMGLIVDVGSDPVDGFRTGYLYAGLLVITLGIVAALLIHPEADLRRFRRLGITQSPDETTAPTQNHSHMSAPLAKGGLSD